MLTLAERALVADTRRLLEAATSFLTTFPLANLPLGGGVALATWIEDGKRLGETLITALAQTAPIDLISNVAEVVWAVVDAGAGAGIIAAMHIAISSGGLPAGATTPAAALVGYIDLAVGSDKDKQYGKVLAEAERFAHASRIP